MIAGKSGNMTVFQDDEAVINGTVLGRAVNKSKRRCIGIPAVVPL
jgi:hypothetical protein